MSAQDTASLIASDKAGLLLDLLDDQCHRAYDDPDAWKLISDDLREIESACSMPIPLWLRDAITFHCWHICVNFAKDVSRESANRVYFILDRDNIMVKIGYTSSPEMRLSQIQCHNHSQLELLHEMEGGQRDEAALHKRFKSLKVRGEWFRYVGDLRSYIELLICGQS